MRDKLSPRLAAFLEALPLEPELRVLEIGCEPGAPARAMSERMAGGYVLGIDRSDRAIQQAVDGSSVLMAQGMLGFRVASADAFWLETGEAPFDLGVAIPVGALDGRHPDQIEPSLRAIAASLRRSGRLFIDGGDPLREVDLENYR